LIPIPKRYFRRELLDDADGPVTHAELCGSLADIRLINRRLGGISSSLAHLDRIASGLAPRRPGKPLHVLDVASGSADIPAAMVEWARARRMPIRVVALDMSMAITGHASELTGDYPEISCVVADGLSLPFGRGSFDIVHCSLALHHFSEQDAVRLISGMARVASRNIIVCDLRRSWVAYSLIYMLSRLLTSNRLTRHDGPVSVLRSFTPDELASLAAKAGLDGFSVTRHPFWRMALVGGAK
jgi:Methyltransferase domain